MSDPLQAACASATNGASDGDLGQMREMLDPSVRWIDGVGNLRAHGRPDVIAVAQGRADSGALSGARLEIQVDEIEDGPGPGPNRQMCVRDPDGHGHMIAELWPDSIADDPRPSVGPIGRLLARVRPPGRPRPNRARA